MSSGRVRVSVIDTGYGIPVEYQDQLFEPFSRLNMADGQIDGTGIGPTICKRLVEAMDGEIGFDTELNISSEFWFEVSRAPLRS